MFYLNVPYAEKDEAKKLGAKWNSERKQWYAPSSDLYDKFAKWMPEGEYEIITDHIYLVEGLQKCPNCGKETRVFTLACDTYMSCYIYNDDEEDDDDNSIEMYDDSMCFCKIQLTDSIRKKIMTKFPFVNATKYINNHCEFCNKAITNIFTHGIGIFDLCVSPDGKPETYKFYKIKLEEDIKGEVDINGIYGIEDSQLTNL